MSATDELAAAAELAGPLPPIDPEHHARWADLTAQHGTHVVATVHRDGRITIAGPAGYTAGALIEAVARALDTPAIRLGLRVLVHRYRPPRRPFRIEESDEL